jgi:uncharacterized protein (TIGR02646 family)
MTHIDKHQNESLLGRQHIENWLDSIKGHNAEEQIVTYREYIEPMYDNRNKSGADIWNVMTDKKGLKKFLLQEQGFVCCYCGRRLFNDHNTLIEHLTPKGGSAGDKRKVYDYDNLMASCMGGTKHILHLVRNSTETVESIAVEYGISIERIEELYVDDEQFAIVNKKYDIENLQIGDRVLIIKQAEIDSQHCGHKKDDNPINIYPLLPHCDNYFRYALKDQNEAILSSIDQHAKDTIDILGLNNNPVLNRDRKGVIDKAQELRDRIMSNPDRVTLIRQQIASFSPRSKYAPSENHEDAPFFRKPFWFVELAVFQGRVNLSDSQQ